MRNIHLNEKSANNFKKHVMCCISNPYLLGRVGVTNLIEDVTVGANHVKRVLDEVKSIVCSKDFGGIILDDDLCNVLLDIGDNATFFVLCCSRSTSRLVLLSYQWIAVTINLNLFRTITSPRNFFQPQYPCHLHIIVFCRKIRRLMSSPHHL